MSLAAATPLEAVLEKEWDSMLFKASGSRPGLAPTLGWDLTYHTLRSKGSRAGFPDRVLVRGDRVIFAELKRERRVATPLTAEQRRWLDALAGAGMECYLWRPSDLDEVAQILSKRWRFDGRTLRHLDGPWTPGSLWLPGAGRSDGTT
jgi:hypothetical protein